MNLTIRKRYILRIVEKRRQVQAQHITKHIQEVCKDCERVNVKVELIEGWKQGTGVYRKRPGIPPSYHRDVAQKFKKPFEGRKKEVKIYE